MRKLLGVMAALAVVGAGGAFAQSDGLSDAVERSKTMVPSPPWGEGDQVGMANALGQGTWLRCAAHLAAPNAKAYELSHERSNTMPLSPFGVPLKYVYRPTVGIPGTVHAFNGEQVESGEPGAQGTQLDALGHFAILPQPWDGQGDFPAGTAQYYGGALQGKAGPPEGVPDGQPFAIHSFNLAEAGIHQIQNARLGDLATDKVWTSCTMILPLRSRGGSGSPVRPVSIGTPGE
jgi:hypothetical protein